MISIKYRSDTLQGQASTDVRIGLPLGEASRKHLDNESLKGVWSRGLFGMHYLGVDRVLISLDSPLWTLNLAHLGWCLPQMGTPLPQSFLE
jgi:hypothetical protein